MNAIDFVVRSRTGSIERGSIAGPDQGFVIPAGAGNDISLNILQADLRGYDRADADLLITLADGRVIVLKDYFVSTPEDANRLFLSAEGNLNEVSFVESSDGGALFAQYGPTETWGKWSPSDQLIFLDEPAVVAEGYVPYGEEEEVSMLAAGLLGSSLLGSAGAGAAGLAGLALLGAGNGGGGNGGGSGGETWIPPTVDNPDAHHQVGGGSDQRITVSGTANPGSTVVVVIGDETVNGTAGDDRIWDVTFEDETFPDDGIYPDVTVTVSDPNGTVTDLDGPSITIDTTPPVIELVDGTVSVGDLFNGESHQNGVTVTGRGEVGAELTVTVGDDTRTFVIGEDGTWSVTYDDAVLPGGEYLTDITVTGRDSFNNVTTVVDQIQIDTVPHPLAIDAVTGDNLINAAEAEAGFAITGTSSPGAVVTVTFGALTREVVTGADGSWSLAVASGDVEAGEYTGTITASTVDPAGNASSTVSEVRIDTLAEVALTNTPLTGDDRISAAEWTAGVTLTGTSQPGSSVSVSIEGVTKSATVSADGSWNVTFSSASLPAGTYSTVATVTAVDDAGNSATTTHAFAVDTETALTIATATIATDGVINAAEAAAGVQVTGTAEPGATVVVTSHATQDGMSFTTTANASGAWSVTFPAAAIPPGELSLAISAVATDALGNTASASGSVEVDTVTVIGLETASVETDGIVNAAERADGVPLAGTAEAGASVVVTVAGTLLTTTAAADGTWQVMIPASLVPTGETSLPVTATATDAAGNRVSASGSIAIDTVTNVAVMTTGVEGDGVINAAEAADGVVLTGTAQPGASVQVTMGGISHSATVAADGSWTASFSAAELPSGETTLPVTAVATDAAGNTATDTGEVRVDTLVTNYTNTSSVGGADQIVNATEAAAGVTFRGTVEAGSTVMVALAGVSLPATVDAGGNWSVTFAPSQVPSGERTVTMTATATDAAGNTSQLSQTVRIDTDAGLLTISPEPVETDDLVNAAEAADGVVLTGTSNPGQIVQVTMGGVTHSVQTGTDGIWFAPFAAHELQPGTYTADITATITDSAGNSLTRTDTLNFDTEVVNFAPSGSPITADNVVNGAEAAAGVSLSGTTEPGATVTVTIEGVNRPATVDAAGNWTVRFGANDLPSGEYDTSALVQTTDRAGNTAEASVTFRVDTQVHRLTLSSDPVTADNVVNAEEAQQGITLTGEVEIGSSVVVTMGGMAHVATVNAAGRWTVDIPPESIPRGDLDAQVRIEATDAAGNTRSLTDSVAIDTLLPDAPNVESYTRDHIGLRGVTLETTSADIDIGHVVSDTLIEDVGFADFAIPTLGETSYTFTQIVPDGSHLVIAATDDAGNTSGTYLVVDDTKTSEVAMSDDLANTLSTWQVGTIDLQFAEDSHLTITEDQILALSSTTDTLIVQGGVDDSVTIVGAQAQGTQHLDGTTFNVFGLGDATLLIEDEITNVVI